MGDAQDSQCTASVIKCVRFTDVRTLAITRHGPPRKNRVRRSIGAVLCLSLAFLLLASLMAAFGDDPRPPFASVGLAIGSLGIALLNFHLPFIGPRIWGRQHGRLEGMLYVSGLPLLGTFLVLSGCLFCFGAFWTAIILDRDHRPGRGGARHRWDALDLGLHLERLFSLGCLRTANLGLCEPPRSLVVWHGIGHHRSSALGFFEY